MSSGFHFRQFAIQQDRCAMKVSTDALLLGTWAQLASAKTIMDIGTGTGILALLAAERAPHAMVDAIELDDAAAAQASQNAADSPFVERIKVHRADVRRVKTETRYDHIICNPPYYRGERPSAEETISVAKHSVMLTFSELVEVVNTLLAPNGCASFILPANRWDEFVALATENSLSLQHRTDVRYQDGGPVKRVLGRFGGTPRATKQDEITVRRNGTIAVEYAAMLEPYLEDPRV